MAYEAKIIKDSITPRGHRLTTMQVTHPRIVHSEFNTHNMFARNSSSSRAIPFSKVVEKVMNDPFIPKYWGINQSGMQASADLQGMDRENAICYWLKARDQAVEIATKMADKDGLNVHKQIVNRLLEPWSWITVCVTGDPGAWSNYFALRCDKDAQPDIQEQAYMAQYAYFISTPEEVMIEGWHTPYLQNSEDGLDKLTDSQIVQISVGRCARTSYLTQEGKRDFSEDVKLHNRLVDNKHFSPCEHVCKAMDSDERYAKYIGWKAYRHMLPREYITDFQPNHPDLVSSASR